MMIGQTSPLSQTLQSLQSSRLLWRVVIALLLSFFLLHLALLKSNGVGVHGLSYFKYKSTEWEEDDLLKDVHNSTLGFEKILAINLPSRTDRRDALLVTGKTADIEFEFVDGVNGDEIPQKALPPGNSPAAGSLGSWRAHMNALVEVVRQNLTTALIVEDDLDWDIRLKSQLQDYARSSRALIQPLEGSTRIGNKQYADPTFPLPTDDRMSPVLDFDNLPPVEAPSISPYGDGWSILWLGHCGVSWPNTQLEPVKGRSLNLPKGRVVHLNDSTVPELHYFETFRDLYGEEIDNPRAAYPAHTRIVHHALNPVCTLAYAVTQHAARQILYELGVKKLDAPFDLMMGGLCEGGGERPYLMCLTSQPQLFNHWRPAGNRKWESDINDHGDEMLENGFSEIIRWSARKAVDGLLRGGDVSEVRDQYPDIES